MRKSLKMIGSFVIVFALVLMFVGCGTQTTQTNEPASDNASEPDSEAQEVSEQTDAAVPKIGVTIAGNASGFMQYVVSGMYQYRDETDDVELTVVYADDQPEKQNAQVETFIGQGMDVIILQPCDLVALEPAVEAAVKAEIPILTVNTPVGNQEMCLAYCGSDSVESGEIQAERICEQLDYKGNVAILEGKMGHPAQIDRYKGYTNIIDGYPDVNIVFTQTANWDTAQAQAITENWLETETKIDAFLCECDTIAIGVLNALEQKGLAETTLVAGMDCIPEVMDLIAEGKIDNSIWQDGVAQGYAGIEVAMNAFRGEETGDAIIPYEVCSKENIQDYVEKAKVRDALSDKYF